ncbi:conjugal transfer protein TraJ [Salmonella enterica subsp. enterica serovar Virchow]|nr:conjugal transfer protein TraJ [Salmonella enterica subsp. enterica serovar Virchow]
MKTEEEKAKTPHGGRPRGVHIKVWLTPEEKAAIAQAAANAGLAESAYLRALGLNTPIRSVLDLDAVTDMVKVNGDLGRVAGLLKLWLAEKRGQGAQPIAVEVVMDEFRDIQKLMRDLIARALNDR